MVVIVVCDVFVSSFFGSTQSIVVVESTLLILFGIEQSLFLALVQVV